jgi:hypothetical protein
MHPSPPLAASATPSVQHDQLRCVTCVTEATHSRHAWWHAAHKRAGLAPPARAPSSTGLGVGHPH